MALIGEGQIARGEAPLDGFLVRGMGGTVHPGTGGELTAFVSLDGGNGKGRLVKGLRRNNSDKYRAGFTADTEAPPLGRSRDYVPRRQRRKPRRRQARVFRLFLRRP